MCIAEDIKELQIEHQPSFVIVKKLYWGNFD
jgi:hypothetical protein